MVPFGHIFNLLSDVGQAGEPLCAPVLSSENRGVVVWTRGWIASGLGLVHGPRR